MILAGHGLGKWYGANRALDDVSIEVRGGEILAIAGDNGAGKSTLIKLLSGVLRPDEGTILVDGEPAAFAGAIAARERGIETIYQDLAVAGNLSVAGNIFLGFERRKRRLGLFPVLDWGAMNKQAGVALERLDVKIRDVRTSLDRLSGGQRQGVALARALNRDADIVIMDEPTAALGVAQQEKVLETIIALKQQGVGVILVTHTMPHILQVADRVMVLRRGVVVGERPASELTEHELVTMIVGGAGQPGGPA
jgi:simple sugar transport system ATP-binding protein